MREEERIADQSNIGPGTTDGFVKSFGSDMNKVGMGAKYQSKYDKNPGPGEYDVVSPTKWTKDRKYEAMIF